MLVLLCIELDHLINIVLMSTLQRASHTQRIHLVQKQFF